MAPALPRTLDYVILLCDRLNETREFYRTALQLPLEDDRPQWVSFRVGSGLLTLRPRGRGVAGDDGPAAPGSASVQLAFRVPPPAIDEWHDRLVAQGIAIASPPKDLPKWRHRTLFVRDPEGNVVELYAEI